MNRINERYFTIELNNLYNVQLLVYCSLDKDELIYIIIYQNVLFIVDDICIPKQ